jgi:hypothetical protein
MFFFIDSNTPDVEPQCNIGVPHCHISALKYVKHQNVFLPKYVFLPQTHVIYVIN